MNSHKKSARSQDSSIQPAPEEATSAQHEFERLGPWMSRFDIDGVALGGIYNYNKDPRLRHFEHQLGSLQGKRILELGALEGGHTLELSRAGALVTAIEGSPSNYERCLFIQRYFQLDQAEFVCGDVRSIDFTQFGCFDVILNSGILYHLDAPWELLEKLGKVAQAMLLWTHCARAPEQSIQVGSHHFRGSWYTEGELDHPLSGLQQKSFWPTRESLEQMLNFTGWSELTWLDIDEDCQPGPGITLWARRPSLESPSLK